MSTPPEPTLSTLVPIATTNTTAFDSPSASPPYTPKSSTFALPSQSIIDGHPVVNPNPTLFSFLSKLALRGGSGESGANSEDGEAEEDDEEETNVLDHGEGLTDSPKEVEEIDMAPDGRWEEHQHKEKRRGEFLSWIEENLRRKGREEEEVFARRPALSVFVRL